MIDGELDCIFINISECCCINTTLIGGGGGVVSDCNILNYPYINVYIFSDKEKML